MPGRSREEQFKKFEKTAKRIQKERLEDYEKDFGQKPNLPTTKDATEIYANINKTEPYFRTSMIGPTTRLEQIVSSQEFKDALTEDLSGKESFFTDNEPSEKDKQAADKASEALKWSIDAFKDAYGPYSNSQAVEGVRQSHQFKELLRKKGPNGRSFYEAMKIAAKKIEVKEAEGSDAEKKKAEANKIIYIGDDDKPKKTLFDDFYDDLAYIDHAYKMGINLPRLDAESRKSANLSFVDSWEEYRREHLNNIPHDPEEKKDYLAKILISSFESGMAPEKRDAFSVKKIDDFVKQLKKKPEFKKLCEDPARVKELLKADPKDPDKHYNVLKNIYSPFADVPKEKANSVLRKIKSMLPHMDGKGGRGDKWKALIDSISSIDLDDPKNSGNQKLQEIYEKTTAYQKGKKSLRSKESDQNRMDQSMDVLSELANSGLYAKMAAEAVIDRTNEVRLKHDKNYDTISLGGFGASHLGKHVNNKPVKYGTDALPQDPRMLPSMPAKELKSAAPISEYTELLLPLASDKQLSDMEAIEAVATAIALSKAPVYYYDDDTNKKDTKKMLKKHGRAVINSGKLTQEVMRLENDPEVKKLAQKYKDPEARKALFTDGRPDLAVIKDKTILAKGKEEKTYKRAELPLTKEGRPDLTKLKPDKTEKIYLKDNFDVSKLKSGIITQEYAQAKNPVQKMPG